MKKIPTKSKIKLTVIGIAFSFIGLKIQNSIPVIFFINKLIKFPTVPNIPVKKTIYPVILEKQQYLEYFNKNKKERKEIQLKENKLTAEGIIGLNFKDGLEIQSSKKLSSNNGIFNLYVKIEKTIFNRIKLKQERTIGALLFSKSFSSKFLQYSIKKRIIAEIIKQKEDKGRIGGKAPKFNKKFFSYSHPQNEIPLINKILREIIYFLKFLISQPFR